MAEYTLAEIENAIAARDYLHQLPPPLEKEFLLRNARFQRQLTRGSMWPTILTYNAFLPVDFLLVPNTFGLAVFLHLAVTVLIAGLCMRHHWLPERYDSRWLMALIPISMVGQIMIVYFLNATPNAVHYQYLAVMIVVYSNITQRLGVDFAKTVSLTCGLMYGLFLVVSGAPLPVLIVGIALMFAAGHLTLLANTRMQRDERFAFLQRVREETLRRNAERQSLHDPLTRLGNRRSLQLAAEDLWSTARQDGRSVAVILVDIDNFKRFNDSQGHTRGDECLFEIGTLIAELVRETQDVAVRYGGEEFLVLAADVTTTTAFEIAERLRMKVKAAGIRHPENPPSGVVTTSLGVAAADTATATLQELIEAADIALYEAKRCGRDRSHVSPVGQLRSRLQNV